MEANNNNLTQGQPFQLSIEEVGDAIQSNDISHNANLEKGMIRSESKSTANSTCKRKATRPASFIWDHFTKLEVEDPEFPFAKCNWCGEKFACHSSRNGTTTMKKHLEDRCKKYPYGSSCSQSQQTHLARFVKKSKQGEDVHGITSLGVAHATNENIRAALVKMIIIDELSFKLVENEGFHEFCSIAIPRFNIPSRWTIARDVLCLYASEKQKLRDDLSKSKARVCLTTDCWTSLQNLNYLCLTAHFIDDNWILHKKILNFCLISNHKGETIGRLIERCLLDWGIEGALTITVDNASSNDTAIAYLKKKMSNWKGTIQSSKYLHVRCMAHTLNLIVGDGLKDMNESIIRIRNAVRYVRASPSRMAVFKQCIEEEKISSSSLVCLDVPTRWNSTYKMLDSALKFEKAFDRLEEVDLKYVRENTDDARKMGTPCTQDWQNAKKLLSFLKVFYDITCKISGSLYVTSIQFIHHLTKIDKMLKKFNTTDDLDILRIVHGMMSKYLKYWGDIEKINIFLFVAVALDPRYKIQFVDYCFDKLYSQEVAHIMKITVLNFLRDLFAEYSAKITSSGNEFSGLGVGGGDCGVSSRLHDDNIINENDLDIAQEFAQDTQEENASKDELATYLTDTRESLLNSSFDILNWWKVNSSKFVVLSEIAKDVLAIPITTVPSESAFSAGGRVLDPYRSSLTPKTVEALVCTNDWLKSSSTTLDIEEVIEELEKVELDFFSNEKELTNL